MIKPKKSLGQNFLKDKNIRNKIINLSKINRKIIIEIGPGLGFLTDAIIKQNPRKLILIEKDKNLYLKLFKKYNQNKNVEIFNTDAVKFDYNKFNNVNIISNLPYNISTKLIYKLIKLNNINELVLMIQKEVAIKLDYKRKKMNKYKFLINLLSEYKICFNVKPNSFFPIPKVQSSVIKIKLKKINHNWEKLDIFIKSLFKNKRKIISNLIYFKKNHNENILKKRIEELSFDEVLKLYEKF